MAWIAEVTTASPACADGLAAASRTIAPSAIAMTALAGNVGYERKDGACITDFIIFLRCCSRHHPGLKGLLPQLSDLMGADTFYVRARHAQSASPKSSRVRRA